MTRRSAWQPVTVSLRRLFPSASFVGCGDIRVNAVTDRSGSCTSGGLFAAVRGTRQDGLRYVEESVAAGASSLLVPHPVSSAPVPQCVVHDVRSAYSRLCQAVAGDPSSRLSLAGVTGTNGKTTIAWMLRAIWQAAGHSSGLLGTIEYDDGGHTQQAELTTPDAGTLASWLAAMVARGTTHAVLELSSHALDQDRAVGVSLDAVLLSNLTQDHFDYHGDFSAYAAAKSKILKLCSPSGTIVYNADDPRIVSMVEEAGQAMLQGRVCLSFGIECDADVVGRVVDETVSETRFVVESGGRTGRRGEKLELTTGLVGHHNILNCLAATTLAREQGISDDAIAAGLGSLAWVPGRLEAVECGLPFDVFVDYAHTEDALRRCLGALRRVMSGRLICVFGAGGDRDKLKRPLLGAAAAEAADVCIVTSDNPRGEDPQRILTAIAEGVCGAGGEPVLVEDRHEAIALAIDIARAGDVVLVAGKGHESYQEIGGRRLRFDDREVVRATLKRVTRGERTERSGGFGS